MIVLRKLLYTKGRRASLSIEDVFFLCHGEVLMLREYSFLHVNASTETIMG